MYMRRTYIFTISAVIFGVTLLLFFKGSTFYTAPKQPFNLSTALLRKNIVPALIIGSGPAGLGAALYTARTHIKTLVICGNESGGQLTETTSIENWPAKKKLSGAALMNEFKEQVTGFGADLLNDTVAQIDFSTWPFTVITQGGKTLHALCIIIATGSSPEHLNVPGAQEYLGKGIAVCSICDAPFHKGKKVAVIGGNEPDLERALQLAAYAQKVTVIVDGNQLQAARVVQEYIQQQNNIEILFNTNIKRIIGDTKKVTGLELYTTTTGKNFTIPVDAAYITTGYTPNSHLFAKFIKTDADGYIMVEGRTQKTSLPGVFAAGMVADKLYPKAGVAVGSGIKAALDLINFLQDIGYTPQVAEQAKHKLFTAHTGTKGKISTIETVEQLNQKLSETDKIAVIEFFAPYCPQCTQFTAHFEHLASTFKDKAHFLQVNVKKSPELSKQFAITSIPALFILKQGTCIAHKDKATNQALHDFISTTITNLNQNL